MNVEYVYCYEGRFHLFMKIAVITRHAISNYGSLLQAIATQEIIEGLGHTCQIIDYIRDDELYSRREYTLLKRKPEWNNNPIKRVLYLMLRQPESLVAGKKFENARRKYLKLTKRYTSAKQLVEDKPVADVYVTGSDQVWGPVENGSYDSIYCLSFTEDSAKRIAYAASFGHSKMTEKLELYYKKWLGRYKYLTVREDSAVSIINKLGLEGFQVLDPTLLLDKNYWHKYIKEITQKKYILIYQLHNDKKLGKYAKKVSEAKKLPLIRISASFHQITREGKFIWLPDLGEFLSYIKNAECMITDSFHGTAFAINFNVPFIEVLPNNNTGTRNVSILNMTGLTDRILKDENDIELVSKKIDFEKVNKILQVNRKKSISILKTIIES